MELSSEKAFDMLPLDRIMKIHVLLRGAYLYAIRKAHTCALLITIGNVARRSHASGTVFSVRRKIIAFLSTTAAL